MLILASEASETLASTYTADDTTDKDTDCNLKGKGKQLIDTVDLTADSPGNSDDELQADTTLVEHESESWEEYNSTAFGPDVTPGLSGNAGPSGAVNDNLAASNAGPSGTSNGIPESGGDQEPTPVFDELVTFNLLSSSQRSFSNLNIDNPYGSNADFGLEFD